MKKSPLHARHVASGATMAELDGWEMPVELSGREKEHQAVRSGAGVFDVSHLGELEVAGKDAPAAMQAIFCSDVSALLPGQAQYSAILNERGTFVDDVVPELQRRGLYRKAYSGTTLRDHFGLRKPAPGEYPAMLKRARRLAATERSRS